MACSTIHMITSFLLVLVPYATPLTINMTNINPQNLNHDIVIEGIGANISDIGIHLTPDQIGSNLSLKARRATYIRQLHLWDNKSGELASFSTNFIFVIDSNGASEYGDGLTFFLAQDNSLITKGGAMGLPIDPEKRTAINQFVAVEFDTYWNSWDPLDSSLTPTGDHVGISISSLLSVRDQKWLSNISGGGICQAWITYDSDSKNLSVAFTGFINNKVIRQDGLVYTVDLRKELPEWVIFGFSVATGSFFQRNTVRSWTFYSFDIQGDQHNQWPPTPSPDSLVPSLGSANGQEKNKKVGLIAGLSATIIFFVVFSFVLWKRQKNRKDVAQEIASDIEMNHDFEPSMGPKQFSYNELAKATNDFSENEKLGEGGFGSVYRGFLKDSKTFVAVKRVSKSSKQGIKEYASEVRIISRLRHRNLVQLTGWCRNNSTLLLVYEYMENGSLDSHLFKEKSSLAWSTRYKIAHGLASALVYLHEEWEQCVLHRDIKSSNVMLDSNFNAKLGDFGLAKLVDHEKGSKTTKLAGTVGYIAPECVVTGKASKESDVYSFGCVALEIACGRKSIDNDVQEDQARLLEWVWELYGRDALLQAADSRMGIDSDGEGIKRLMIVGLWCMHPDSQHRPSMRQAIQVLNCEASLPILPLTMPVASYTTSPMVLKTQTNTSIALNQPPHVLYY